MPKAAVVSLWILELYVQGWGGVFDTLGLHQIAESFQLHRFSLFFWGASGIVCEPDALSLVFMRVVRSAHWAAF